MEVRPVYQGLFDFGKFAMIHHNIIFKYFLWSDPTLDPRSIGYQAGTLFH